MNDLKVFDYNEMPIRTIQNDSELWWVLTDVCRVLEIKNVTQTAQRLEDDEKAMFDIGLKTGNRANCINEPGLYSVILRSDKPEAKRFKRWVTHEVLPSIRKNGGYGINDEKMELAKLIASCKNAAAVKGILSIYGVSTNTHNFTHVIEQNATDSITEYLKTIETWEMMNTPCNTVYRNYVSFCKSTGVLPATLSGFSRAIHQRYGLIVRRRRINGKLTGFYT